MAPAGKDTFQSWFYGAWRAAALAVLVILGLMGGSGEMSHGIRASPKNP